jgi:hypothetical protein
MGTTFDGSGASVDVGSVAPDEVSEVAEAVVVVAKVEEASLFLVFATPSHWFAASRL